MPTCGYICPSCGGSEVMGDGSPCVWCGPLIAIPKVKTETLTDEEWMDSVHFGSCCSDLPENSSEESGKISE
ncbi:hypothetical protein [Cytophaga aurantiaca]|uniref:hypothetical protein n=1 Tax=Cytophaga aurantiaca TaxID=29530 RepID=UPI00037C35E2|nr:hypothetical protein [Cytophaga aurantiaca]